MIRIDRTDKPVAPVAAKANVGVDAQASRAAPSAGGTEAMERARRSESLAAPVDEERVEAIRDAIKEGRYPLKPAEIADALIAAGMFGIYADD